MVYIHAPGIANKWPVATPQSGIPVYHFGCGHRPSGRGACGWSDVPHKRLVSPLKATHSEHFFYCSEFQDHTISSCRKPYSVNKRKKRKMRAPFFFCAEPPADKRRVCGKASQRGYSYAVFFRSTHHSDHTSSFFRAHTPALCLIS